MISSLFILDEEQEIKLIVITNVIISLIFFIFLNFDLILFSYCTRVKIQEIVIIFDCKL
jgi:hypothetical protein